MKCKTCGKNADSELCFKCKPRKPLSSGRGFSSNIKFLKKNNEKVTIQKKFFLSIWKKRPHKSEVSGEYLGQEALSTYFHHILPKSKYPEACLDEENIIILSFIEHQQVESDMYRYEEINKRRNLLKLKYEN
jgi:hypothetical protein